MDDALYITRNRKIICQCSVVYFPFRIYSSIMNLLTIIPLIHLLAATESSPHTIIWNPKNMILNIR